MRLKVSRSKNSASLYVIKTVYIGLFITIKCHMITNGTNHVLAIILTAVL